MFYCVLAGFIALLISGKTWLSFAAMAVVGMAVIMLKSHGEELIKKRGGVAYAKILGKVCYKDIGSAPNPRYTEYTVLVHYRNGEKVRYVLSGDQALFKALRPYLAKA